MVVDKSTMILLRNRILCSAFVGTTIFHAGCSGHNIVDGVLDPVAIPMEEAPAYPTSPPTCNVVGTLMDVASTPGLLLPVKQEQPVENPTSSPFMNGYIHGNYSSGKAWQGIFIATVPEAVVATKLGKVGVGIVFGAINDIRSYTPFAKDDVSTRNAVTGSYLMDELSSLKDTVTDAPRQVTKIPSRIFGRFAKITKDLGACLGLGASKRPVVKAQAPPTLEVGSGGTS